MQKKIILHCGAPKTGSSSFQHLLYGNVDLLRQAGFYVPAVSRKKRPKEDLRILLASLHKPNASKPAKVKNIRAVVERTFEEGAYHTLIISHEGVLGTPFAPGRKQFYGLADKSAEMIAKVFEGYNVEVRFFVRDYAGFVPSWYVQSVRMGSRLKFEEFVKRSRLAKASWKAPVGALVRHFGLSNVRVFDHADLARNTQATLAEAFPDVMAALGERGHDIPRKNKTIGKGMVNIYRRWNQIAPRLAPTPAMRKSVRHLVRHYVLLPLERFSRSEKLTLDPALAAELSARYRKELAAFRLEMS